MTTVAIVGAGLIGRSWAVVFARAGMTVRLWDPDDTVRAGLTDAIRAMLAAGDISSDAIRNVSVHDTLADAVRGVDYVQENGPERLEDKQALFAELDRLVPDDAVLASSSSALVPSRFSEGLAGRARMLVAHPVNPPHVVPIVELCPSPDTTPEAMDRTEALMRTVGQVPTRMTREIDGFVLNRLQAVLLAEAFSLVDQGIVSVKGLDDTIRHGLARRWAFLGPLATIYLNAPSGVGDYINRYGAMLAGLADDCTQGAAFTPAAGAKIAEAFPPPDHVPSLSTWRDGELAALDRYLRSRDAASTKGL